MSDTELDPVLTHTLIRCNRCKQLISGGELKEHNGKCPTCGTQLAKPSEETLDS
jgi:PHP family Zn ribbon phosphoesterase